MLGGLDPALSSKLDPPSGARDAYGEEAPTLVPLLYGSMYGSVAGTSHSKRRSRLPGARNRVRLLRIARSAVLLLAGLPVAAQ